MGKSYIKTPFVDFDVIEEIFGKVLKNKKNFVFFLESFLDVDDKLALQHFEHSNFALDVFSGEFILIAIFEFLDGNWIRREVPRFPFSRLRAFQTIP